MVENISCSDSDMLRLLEVGSLSGACFLRVGLVLVCVIDLQSGLPKILEVAFAVAHYLEYLGYLIVYI